MKVEGELRDDKYETEGRVREIHTSNTYGGQHVRVQDHRKGQGLTRSDMYKGRNRRDVREEKRR